MAREYMKYLVLVVVLALILVSGAVMAQTPVEAVAAVIADSGVFPAGTTVINVTIDGTSATVELSPDAAPFDLSEAVHDDMVLAASTALHDFGVTQTTLTVDGKPILAYLPAPAVAAPSGGDVGVMSLGTPLARPTSTAIGVTSLGGGGGAGSTTPPLTGELAGKNVALHPSHGAYYDNRSQYRFWRWTQRTVCGPNPKTNRPPGWSGSVYQPSDYYYWTKGFQWPSFTEDWRTPNEIRFLRSYLESSGCNVLVSRNLDVNAGLFDADAYGYPNADFTLYKWVTAAKYHLQEIGAPEAVWNEPALANDSDKDIRARPYWANYNMLGWWHWPLTQSERDYLQNNPQIWQNWISFSLHTNAVGAGYARGTEAYRFSWSSKDPNYGYGWLVTPSQNLATAMCSNVTGAVNTEYDGRWAEPMYKKTPGVNPPEWPSGVGNYVGYTQGSWANRGPKSGDYGEVREACMPAILMEMLFHDDWKWYPDHIFALDPIWQATAAWGMYKGICSYWGITPKPIYAAGVSSVSFPTLVGPNAAISGTVTMQNKGMAWCWGEKWVTGIYGPYNVWNLQATADDQFGAAGTKIAIGADAVIYPSETATFSVSLTGPATTGLYTTKWQMLKDDGEGGAFGDVASAQIQVDADPPVITITSPTASDYAYGQVKAVFSATDALSSVKSIVADIDGVAVTNGQIVSWLALGNHTLTVTATDTFGNSTSQSVTFSVVNSAGLVTVGGWIELVDKKATCGFECQYTQGDPAPTGNLTYQDHDTGMTIKSVNMVAMGIVGNHAWFYGTCTVDGEAGHWFRVDVIDNGEPGDTDVFNIQLDTGYSKGDVLGGGNVTIH